MSILTPQAAHHDHSPSGQSPSNSSSGGLATFATLFLKDLALLRPIAATVTAFVLLAALVVAALPLLGVSALRWFGYTQRDDLFDRLDPVASIALVGGALVPFLCAPMILQGDRSRGAGSFFATLPISCTTRWMSKLAAALVVGLVPFVLAGLLRAPSFAVKSDDISNAMSLAALAWLAGAAGAVVVRGVPSAAILGAALAGAIAALAWSVAALIRLPIYRGVFAWTGFDAEFNDYLEGNPLGTFLKNAAPSRADSMPMWLLITTVVAALLLVLWMGRKIVVNGSEPVRKFRGVLVGVCAIALSGSVVAGVLQADHAWRFVRRNAPNHERMRLGFEAMDRLPTDELFRSWIEQLASSTGSPEDALLRWVKRSSLTVLPEPMPDLGRYYENFGKTSAINRRIHADPAAYERIVRGVASGELSATPWERMSAADVLGPYHLAAAAARVLASEPEAVDRLRAIDSLASIVRLDSDQHGYAYFRDGLKMARDGTPRFSLNPAFMENFVGQARARAVVALVALEHALARAARDGDGARLADRFGGPAPVVDLEILVKARAAVERPMPEIRAWVEQARARSVDPADVEAAHAVSVARSVTDAELETIRRGAERPISELFDAAETDPVYTRGASGG